eukprot:TRINITY_DN4414_c0_g1_i1.p1 TRINITY_DN4414_c0_g1~~TRINITY_DN4414_c0_g1_i1.p1  ORF type:complete len:295 (-),score=67.85 TRINITY_DN4414_c0_g1_i1:127-1011(-)
MSSKLRNRKGKKGGGKTQKESNEDLAKKLPHRNELHITRKIFHAINGSLVVLVFLIIKEIVQLAHNNDEVDSFISNIFETIKLLELYLFLKTLSAAQIGFIIYAPIALFFIFLELFRMTFPSINRACMIVFGPFMRSHEVSKPSGMAYYLNGILVVFVFFDETIAILATLYLAYADPIASAFGIICRKVLGTKNIFQAPNDKSVFGTFVAILASIGISYLYLVIYLNVNWNQEQLWNFILAGSISAGLAELAMFGFLKTYFDDNATIPVITALTLYVTSMVLNIQFDNEIFMIN